MTLKIDATIPQPQNPPFAFPARISIVSPWHVRADPAGNIVRDDEGQIIIMRYIGPTPNGRTAKALWVVQHDTPTRVHPADKYVYQRYSLVASS